MEVGLERQIDTQLLAGVLATMRFDLKRGAPRRPRDQPWLSHSRGHCTRLDRKRHEALTETFAKVRSDGFRTRRLDVTSEDGVLQAHRKPRDPTPRGSIDAVDPSLDEPPLERLGRRLGQSVELSPQEHAPKTLEGAIDRCREGGMPIEHGLQLHCRTTGELARVELDGQPRSQYREHPKRRRPISTRERDIRRTHRVPRIGVAHRRQLRREIQAADSERAMTEKVDLGTRTPLRLAPRIVEALVEHTLPRPVEVVEPVGGVQEPQRSMPAEQGPRPLLRQRPPCAPASLRCLGEPQESFALVTTSVQPSRRLDIALQQRAPRLQQGARAPATVRLPVCSSHRIQDVPPQRALPENESCHASVDRSGSRCTSGCQITEGAACPSWNPRRVRRSPSGRSPSACWSSNPPVMSTEESIFDRATPQ